MQVVSAITSLAQDNEHALIYARLPTLDNVGEIDEDVATTVNTQIADIIAHIYASPVGSDGLPVPHWKATKKETLTVVIGAPSMKTVMNLILQAFCATNHWLVTQCDATAHAHRRQP